MIHLTIALIMIVLSSSLKQSQPETLQPNNLLSTLTINETLKNGTKVQVVEKEKLFQK